MNAYQEYEQIILKEEEELARAREEEKRRLEEEQKRALEEQELQRQRLLEEEKQKRLAEQRKAAARLKRKLAFLEAKKNQIVSLQKATPAAKIHVKSGPTVMENIMALQRHKANLAKTLKGYSSDMKFYSQSWFSVATVCLSIAIGILYLMSNFGLDAIGDSQSATIATVIGASLCLDVVAYMMILGLLICVKSLVSESHYVRFLSWAITTAGVVGVVSFAFTIFQRAMEVG